MRGLIIVVPLVFLCVVLFLLLAANAVLTLVFLPVDWMFKTCAAEASRLLRWAKGKEPTP